MHMPAVILSENAPVATGPRATGRNAGNAFRNLLERTADSRDPGTDPLARASAAAAEEPAADAHITNTPQPASAAQPQNPQQQELAVMDAATPLSDTEERPETQLPAKDLQNLQAPEQEPDPVPSGAMAYVFTAPAATGQGPAIASGTGNGDDAASMALPADAANGYQPEHLSTRRQNSDKPLPPEAQACSVPNPPQADGVPQNVMARIAPDGMAVASIAEQKIRAMAGSEPLAEAPAAADPDTSDGASRNTMTDPEAAIPASRQPADRAPSATIAEPTVTVGSQDTVVAMQHAKARVPATLRQDMPVPARLDGDGPQKIRQPAGADATAPAEATPAPQALTDPATPRLRTMAAGHPFAAISSTPAQGPTARSAALEGEAAPLGESRFAQLMPRAATAPFTQQSPVATTGTSEPHLKQPMETTAMDPGPVSTAEILNGKSIRPAAVAEQSSFAMATPSVVDASPLTAGTMATPPASANLAASATLPGKAPILAGANEQAAIAGSVSLAASAAAPSTAAQVTPTAAASLFSVPEAPVIEQVIDNASLRDLGEKRQLTIELHPAELGQVKLDLVQEKDRLQLHLQAATHEVCDILEKHLPRLQEALQQQGLRLDSVQVSVDGQRQHQQGMFEHQQRAPQHGPWQRSGVANPDATVAPATAPADRPSTASGLSLRV